MAETSSPKDSKTADRRPRLIVLGHARHGKDTVAELLRARRGLQFQSSSEFCAERVMMPYFAVAGRPYATVAECFEDRANHRAAWFEQISLYNEGDPGRLARELFESGNDIYVGLRNADELKEARKLATLVVWVDATGRVPPEPSLSCTVTREMADVCIDNRGRLEDLAGAVDAFIRDHLGPAS